MSPNMEGIRENIILFLRALVPVALGFFYLVVLEIPGLGAVWLYAAPFLLIYYWCITSVLFQEKLKSFWKTILFMNLPGILLYLGYLLQLLLILPESRQVWMLTVTRLNTMPLSFLTAWAGPVLDGSLDYETVTDAASIITESINSLLLVLISIIGYYIGKSQNKRKQEED